MKRRLYSSNHWEWLTLPDVIHLGNINRAQRWNSQQFWIDKLIQVLENTVIEPFYI